MAPTLNQDDIKLLKGIFATKEDLNSMEKRFDKKFASKVEMNDRFDQLETILAKTFVNIEVRIQTLEDEVGISKTN